MNQHGMLDSATWSKLFWGEGVVVRRSVSNAWVQYIILCPMQTGPGHIELWPDWGNPGQPSDRAAQSKACQRSLAGPCLCCHLPLSSLKYEACTWQHLRPSEGFLPSLLSLSMHKLCQFHLSVQGLLEVRAERHFCADHCSIASAQRNAARCLTAAAI